MTPATIIVAAVAAILMLPALSDLVCLVRSFRRRDGRAGPAQSPRLLFLVPAHNEEQLIDACARSLLTQRYPADRFDVFVIADNCTDDTAARARAAGAACLERADLALPGKP